VFERLEQIQPRIDELHARLLDPSVSRDPRQLKEINRELSQLQPLAEAAQSWKSKRQELTDLEELRSDPEMKEMAEAEIPDLQEAISTLEEDIRLLLLPRDPYEGRNLILEVRAGTGGDEAALFAYDLFRMYARYAEANGWRFELLSRSEISVGGAGGKSAIGVKEICASVSGETAYSKLRFESGVHRVQRVPLTESQGRIHTSAATVAILPEADEVEININPTELRVDVYRASGPGGQSVNTTDSAVRITHIPTGTVVQCQDEKSQHKNKAKAMKVLMARILAKQEAERHAEEAENRRAQVGSGDRSERIRTYNYPQNRVTDHRINLTLYKLDRIVSGELEEMVTGLLTDHQAELLKAHDL